MDSQRAKEILSAYRPGRDDASNPQFAEALAQARSDPEVARWLEQQTAVDDVIRRKLREAPVPADLLRRLLGEHTLIQPTIPWWQRPAWLAAAAAIVALLVVGGLWLRSPRKDGFVAYRREMAQFIAKPYKLDFKAKTLDEAQRTVANVGWPSDYVVPQPLRTLDLEGGCTMKWRDRKVTLICWSYDNSFWLFVVDRAALPDAPPEGAAPLVAQFGKIATASWTANSKTYIVAAVGDEFIVRRLL